MASSERADAERRVAEIENLRAENLPDCELEWLCAELRAAWEREDEARAFLTRAHDENWTPTGLDKLNTFARAERLPEAFRACELPAQIEAVVFGYKAAGYRRGLAAARAALEKWLANLLSVNKSSYQVAATINDAIAEIDALAAGAGGGKHGS